MLAKGDEMHMDDQVLSLKRLLVTMKQHYEKILQDLHQQLHVQTTEKQVTQQAMQQLQRELEEVTQHHIEEVEALHQQQIKLKEFLKKAREEKKPELIASQQRIEQLERVIPYLRERVEETHLETEQLREELEAAYKKIQILQKEQSPKALTGPLAQRADLMGLEARYMEVLQEKAKQETFIHQLQQQLEQQKDEIELYQLKINDLNKKIIQYDEDKKQLVKLKDIHQEKAILQDRYEWLKEEFQHMSQQLEETIEIRLRTDNEAFILHKALKEQEELIDTQRLQLAQLIHEKETLQQEIQRFRSLLEESEMRLKMAQQHLAKKVKEVALLNEKIEEQQVDLVEHQQILEATKTELHQLQLDIDVYQKQEKKLQEQIHEALKTNEMQVAKWEEKYFKMYDKWQESETRIRDLKKFEEKHQQVQSLLANLGTFMGASFNPSAPFFQQSADAMMSRSLQLDALREEVKNSESTLDDGKDLFGTREMPEKFKPNLFS